MKKRIAILLLVLAVTVLALVSCGKKPVEGEDPAANGENIPKYEKVELVDWQNYMLVYPESAASEETLAVELFGNSVTEKYNVTFCMESDFLLPGEEAPVGTLEILIGETNRPETEAALVGLKANDYTIRLINNRLVIVGGTPSATYRAVNFVINNLLGNEGIQYPEGDTFAVTANYRLDKLTIGGVDISEFRIVRGSGMSSSERLMVANLQTVIADACGVYLDIVLSWADEAEYEILIGDTGRAETSKALEKNRYSVEQGAKKLALYGNGDGANAYVMRLLINAVNAADKENSDINLAKVESEIFYEPSLAEINLHSSINSFKDAYDPDFTNTNNVLNRFYKAVNDLPDEISIIPNYDVSSFPLSLKNQIYVAVDGDDSNPGTLEKPLATVNAALKKIRTGEGAVIWVRGGVYALSSSIKVGATQAGTLLSPVIISAYEDETPVFSTVKSIDAAVFKEVDYASDTRASRIPATAQANIVCVNLFDLGWTKDDLGSISSSGTPTLFINGELQSIARYPNVGEDLLYIDKVYDTGSVTTRDGSWIYQWWIPRVQNWEKWTAANGGSYDWNVTFYHQANKKTMPLYNSEAEAIADAKAIQSFVDAGNKPYKDSYGNTNVEYGWTIGLIDLTPCLWENDGNIWYYGNLFEGWEYGYYNIKEFNVTEKTMTAKTGSVHGAAVSKNSATGHNDYYLFNAIEVLDAPGEWYLDYETGDLYIYKTDDFESSNITYSSTTTIDAFNFVNAEYVILNGVTIDGTSGNGIYINASSDVVVQNCNILNTGISGVLISKSKKTAITYNDISLTEDIMIAVKDNDGARALSSGKVVIQNNIIHNPKESKQEGIRIGGCRNVVSHNYIEDCRIRFYDSVECIVEYNEIRGGSKYESDAGMIYLNGLYHIGNHIRYNYLHDWGTPGYGVYFDDLSSFNYAYYNIIDTTERVHEKATGFCYTSTGHYNVFYGNIFVGRQVDRIDESSSYFNDTAWLGYRWPGISESFVNNYKNGYSKDALFSRFPEIELYLEKMETHVTERNEPGYERNELEVYLRSPAGNIIKNNVVVGTSVCFNAVQNVENGVAVPSFDYVGENYHNKSYEGIFADYLNGDFTINADALEEIKAIIPDFYPLSTDNCGTTY